MAGLPAEIIGEQSEVQRLQPVLARGRISCMMFDLQVMKSMWFIMLELAGRRES